MTIKKNSERNQRITELAKSGASLTRLSRMFGLSNERIRQILIEQNINIQFLKQLRKQKSFDRNLQAAVYLSNNLNRIPTLKEFHNSGICSPETITKIRKKLKESGLKELVIRRKQIPESVLIDELKHLSIELNRTPSIKDIDSFGKFAHSTYFRHFGKLTIAQRLSNLVPNKIGVSTYAKSLSGLSKSKHKVY